MKPLYLLLLIISLGTAIDITSQPLDKKLLKTHPTCADFFDNAMTLLPRYKAAGQFDSIGYIVREIENHCGKTFESFDLNVLLAMQRGLFKVEDFYNQETFQSLETRASYYNQANKGQKKTSFAYNPQATFYRFTANWAAELLQRPYIETNELLICKVLAGQEVSPHRVISKNKEDYPYLYKTMRVAKVFEQQASYWGGAIIAGYWIPTNEMKILGPHPSLGLQVYKHMQQNQIDLTIQIRFLRSAHPYKVMRNGGIYELDHFLGGYVGLDYTRYMIQKRNFEFGVAVGAGYDGFDINKSEDEEYLKPYSIGSLNINTGVRFKYLLRGKGFFGLSPRYNFVNYKNKGGSSLAGNSFSIDLVWGGGF